VTGVAPAPRNVLVDATEVETVLFTRLRWTAVDDATGYKVYSKLRGEAFLQYLDTIIETSLVTGHRWTTTADMPVHVYSVAAIDSSGREGFLSNMISQDSIVQRGDLNRNSVIDITNVILCLRAALGFEQTNPNLFLADMDGDGIINVVDVLLLLRKVVGLN